MDFNVDIQKFGPESLKIVKQISKWGDKKGFEEYFAKYFNSVYKNRSALAFIFDGEVVAYVLLEQMYNADHEQYQCTIRDVVINPDALNSGLEEYAIKSVMHNKNRIVAKNAPTFFVGFADKENVALVCAYQMNGFKHSQQNGDTLVFEKNKQLQKELRKEREC